MESFQISVWLERPIIWILAEATKQEQLGSTDFSEPVCFEYGRNILFCRIAPLRPLSFKQVKSATELH
jgi:hypothetical protein